MAMSALRAQGQSMHVLASSELERIRADAARSVHEPSANEWEGRRKEMSKASQARAAKWGNTIAAQRRQKEEAKKKRLEEIEMGKRELDRQEAEIQVQQRKAAIERAQRMLYEDSDKVKTFSSGMLFSDVLEERQAQIELAQRKRHVEAAEDEEWYELQQKQWAAHDSRETEQEQIRLAKTSQAAEMRSAQLEQAKADIIARRAAAIREGVAINNRAQEEVQRQKQQILDKQAAARKAQEETAHMNKLLQQRRERERNAIEKEERKIEAYAKKKEALAQERKDRAEEKFHEEMQIRQNMIDAANAHLAQLKSNEDTILAQQILAREQADAEREAAKAAFRAREMEACDISRKEQMRQRQEAAVRKKQEDKHLKQQWTEACAQLKEAELQEILDARDYSQAIQQFQLRQVAEKHRRRAKAEERAEMEAIRDIVRSKELDGQFGAYAQACMEEYAQADKDLRPLQVALRKATIPNLTSHTIK
jgi:hypothetical protein